MATPSQKILEEERQKLSCSFDELCLTLHGSKQAVDSYVKQQEIVANDPILRYDPGDLGKSRQESIELMCNKLVRWHELFGYSVDTLLPGMRDMHEQFPMSLHIGMFLTTILNLGTQKQIDKYVSDTKGFRISGCYAQTELGHGSDVQSLETTATYDRQTEQFVLNSPTITSTKWWIGDLGLFATHVVTHAQLIVDNKKYGVQTFILQIRDIDTHKPLPGITVGDVGPKYGYNTKDNGYLRFNNFRIPRDGMLMKYSKVNKNGEFVRVGNEKIGYGTMMKVRNIIIQGAPTSLSQAVTVAVRYSLMRQQFKNENGVEQKVMDYQLQMDKLIPLISDIYVHWVAAKKITDLNNENFEKVLKEDFSMLNDMHGLLCCSKAVMTWSTYFGIEKARQSCGGHGYSDYSGIPIMLREYSPNPTYEGENTVLLLQTARYLVKSFDKAMKGQRISSFVDYLSNYDDYTDSKAKIENIKDCFSIENLRLILRFNAFTRVQKASMKLLEGQSKGIHPKENWDKHCGIVLVDAAIAHFYYWVFKNFQEKIFFISDEKCKAVLGKLGCLYGINQILEKPNVLYESSHINGEQFKLIRQAKEQLLAELRPESLGLIEACLQSDNSLKTAIGRSDGNPYETLYDWAKNKNHLNKPGVHRALKDKVVISAKL